MRGGEREDKNERKREGRRGRGVERRERKKAVTRAKLMLCLLSPLRSELHMVPLNLTVNVRQNTNATCSISRTRS